MPKLELEAIEQVNRTGYPPPFDAPVQGRWYRRLAPAAGLTDFAVSHVHRRRPSESAADCVFVVVGGGKRVDTGGGYSDIDMLFTADGRYTRKDGTPYPAKRV